MSFSALPSSSHIFTDIAYEKLMFWDKAVVHCHTHVMYTLQKIFTDLLHFGHLKFCSHDLLRKKKERKKS